MLNFALDQQYGSSRFDEVLPKNKNKDQKCDVPPGSYPLAARTTVPSLPSLGAAVLKYQPVAEDLRTVFLLRVGCKAFCRGIIVVARIEL